MGFFWNCEIFFGDICADAWILGLVTNSNEETSWEIPPVLRAWQGDGNSIRNLGLFGAQFAYLVLDPKRGGWCRERDESRHGIPLDERSHQAQQERRQPLSLFLRSWFTFSSNRIAPLALFALGCFLRAATFPFPSASPPHLTSSLGLLPSFRPSLLILPTKSYTVIQNQPQYPSYGPRLASI